MCEVPRGGIVARQKVSFLLGRVSRCFYRLRTLEVQEAQAIDVPVVPVEIARHTSLEGRSDPPNPGTNKSSAQALPSTGGWKLLLATVLLVLESPRRCRGSC